MKSKKKTQKPGILIRALRIAAKEAYQSEVIDTQMIESVIGENGTHASKEDWIEEKIESWKHPDVDRRPRHKPRRLFVLGEDNVLRRLRP